MTLFERSRFWPATVLAVLLAALGVLAADPVLLFAAVIPLAPVAYGALVVEPPEDPVSVERTVSDQTPTPGEAVRVTLSVTNESDEYLPDVRVVDGVPKEIAVVDGSPRGHVTLQPEETDSIEYTVRVPRGEVRFDAPGISVRSLSGGAERRLKPDVPTEIRAPVKTDAVPLHEQTARISGRIETNDAGAGIAFHSSREYRPGDPINRVDWNRYASTGELSTVEFHEEKAATVVIVVDDRVESGVVAAAGERDAGLRSREAAGELAGALLDAGDRVGVAVKDAERGFCPNKNNGRWFAGSDVYGSGEAYLPPRGAGSAAETACRRLLETRESVPHDLPLRIHGFWTASDLADHMPQEAQMVLFSPLVDDQPVEAAKTWIARGHPVTVVSPNPIPETIGGSIAEHGRRERRDALQRAGARVIDWEGTDALSAAVERAEVSWR
jgi:uncharacterized repeat protein (TIGR01451 family)